MFRIETRPDSLALVLVHQLSMLPMRKVLLVLRIEEIRVLGLLQFIFMNFLL